MIFCVLVQCISENYYPQPIQSTYTIMENVEFILDPSIRKRNKRMWGTIWFTSIRPVIVALIGLVLFFQACSDNPGGNSKGNALYSAEVNEPVRVIEGDGTNLVFTVTRKEDISNESTVSYMLSGEATYGEDYDDLNTRTVSFTPGQTTAKINLEPLGDDETEEEESVVLTLTNASDGTFDPNSSEATGYIRDGIPSCVGPNGEVLFINFDDIKPYASGAGDATRLSDGYHGFIWGDWWARDDVKRSQDEGKEPGYEWFAGIVSKPNAIYPSFGAQPGYISVIQREEPFVLQSFYMSALGTDDDLPVTLEYRDKGGNVIGEQTFVVSRGEKAFIEPDTNIMYAKCLSTISFNQPVLGASFIIDDMTFVH